MEVSAVESREEQIERVVNEIIDRVIVKQIGDDAPTLVEQIKALLMQEFGEPEPTPEPPSIDPESTSATEGAKPGPATGIR